MRNPERTSVALHDVVMYVFLGIQCEADDLDQSGDYSMEAA